MCFDMRMERTALYASENGFSVIATTNATSRWKDAVQVDESGVRAASAYSGIEYWKADWQTDRMTLLKYQISAGEKFYKQEYCGCTYSLRDSNKWREANGIPKVMIGGEEAGLGERYAPHTVERAKRWESRAKRDREASPKSASATRDRLKTAGSNTATGRPKRATSGSEHATSGSKFATGLANSAF